MQESEVVQLQSCAAKRAQFDWEECQEDMEKTRHKKVGLVHFSHDLT